MVTRFPNWHWRLQQYMRDTKLDPFEYGWNDCVLWAVGAVEAMTGVDLGEPFRDKYHDLAGAERLLLENGWATLADAVTALLAAPLPSVFEARRGDLIWIPPIVPGIPEHGNLTVFFSGRCIGPGPTGTTILLTFDAVSQVEGTMAFPVGERD